MEVKFESQICPCLRKAVSQIQQQEQTQEVKLPENMPDIGRILGSWGQVLIRSKEWRNGSMAVSGGVMAWVLYIPEDGTEQRSVEAWIPFQMKWDLPMVQRDGTVWICPVIKCMDARATSARKIMVRAELQLLGEALEPVEAEVYVPDQLPEDVQLRRESYPVMLPVEAGEKLLHFQQELQIPAQKMLYCHVRPCVIEQKVMAGRLVFRGIAAIHCVYTGDDGQICSRDMEAPFSQYTELDKSHSANAEGKLCVVLTSMELETGEDEKLLLKATAAAQYVIYDRILLELAKDAYSPYRSVTVMKEDLSVPALLDAPEYTLKAEETADISARQILDVSWYPQHGECTQEGDMTELILPSQFRVLYLDTDGALQLHVQQAQSSLQLPSNRENKVNCSICTQGRPETTMLADSVAFSVDMTLCAQVCSDKAMEMVSGLTLGKPEEPNEDRPSLVLRQAGEESLWDIAKEYGSTVDAIKNANRLQQEPEYGQMLLIPIP